jgi:hypothetical protein
LIVIQIGTAIERRGFGVFIFWPDGDSQHPVKVQSWTCFERSHEGDIVDVVTECDWEGKFVAEFIGMETLEPKRGCVVGGYIDGIGIMLLDIQTREYGSVMVTTNNPRTNVVFAKR